MSTTLYCKNMRVSGKSYHTEGQQRCYDGKMKVDHLIYFHIATSVSITYMCCLLQGGFTTQGSSV